MLHTKFHFSLGNTIVNSQVTIGLGNLDIFNTIYILNNFFLSI